MTDTTLPDTTQPETGETPTGDAVDTEVQEPARAPWWRRVLRPYTEVRTVKETSHLLLDLPIGIALFTAVVVMVSFGVGAAFTLIGIPVLVLAGVFLRVAGNVERARARALLDLDELTSVGFPGEGERWWHRIWTCAKDPTLWKELVYSLVMLPWGIATFTVTVVVITVALAGALLPVYFWALPDGTFEGGGGQIAAYSVLGLAAVVLTPWVIRGVAFLGRELVRGLLGTGTRELTQRVQRLSESRARSVDAATAERQRIERALHDGAQMRLTALAMELGRAKERIHTDPEGAAELVDEAHAEAKRALVELRDLARGIHPAVLTDRGLEAALQAIAARAPIPVDVQVSLPARPPAAIEATAYYVVAEGLNNVARHAYATRASVLVRMDADRLVVEVQDNGRGGARIADASGIVPTGLRGLADRVAAVDGELQVSSPPGGPTVLRVEVPCAS
jgi:signal transduction histidine kinase